MWVLSTAKLLYPTAAGDTSLSPLVRGSRRRSWLQPALNAGQGIHLWCGNHGTRWASFLDNPVILPSKQVSTPCTAVVPALGDKYHRWEPSLPLHAILGPCWVFCRAMWKAQPSGTQVGQRSQPAQSCPHPHGHPFG